MRVVLNLTGVTPLVMHNGQLADPDNPITREITILTDKPASKRTNSDNAEIARLEWYGGLYYDAEVGPYIPSWNVLKCLNRGGVITRQGTAVLRGVGLVADKVAVQYDGPRKVDKLWESTEFRWRTMVKIGRSRVPRVRPIFRRWGMEVEIELFDDVMDVDAFSRVVEQAGRAEGLGEARILGNGRFTAEVHA